VAVVGTDEQAKAEASEVDRVLVAIAQRATNKVADGDVETLREPGPSFQEIAVLVVLPRQQILAVGVGGQRLVVLSVVALPGGAGLGVQRGVEVVG
jgi:hypothetical protein